MPTGILNRDLLPDNSCFGCGHENPRGLQLSVVRDKERRDRLLGMFTPSAEMTGFPGILHGGIIYSALDCLATWVTVVLRDDKAFWVLRSASVTYHRPAHPEEELFLTGTLAEQGERGHPVTVHAEARDGAGVLIAEGDFRQVPLSESHFLQISGRDRVPENWRRVFVGD